MPKYLNIIQGSDEWYELRGKYATASEFEKIVSPTGKLSTQADTYANKITANRLGCIDVDKFTGNKWTERGNELESDAIDVYEFTHGVAVQRGGFFIADDDLAGFSPDGLIGDDGIIEVKCPSPHEFVHYVTSGKAAQYHKPQIQGGLLVSGRKWCDLLIYNEVLQMRIIRIERDEEYIELLKTELIKFNNLIKEKTQCLITQ